MIKINVALNCRCWWNTWAAKIGFELYILTEPHTLHFISHVLAFMRTADCKASAGFQQRKGEEKYEALSCTGCKKTQTELDCEMNLHHSFWLTGYLDRRELFTWMHEKKFKKRKKYQRGFVPQTSSPLPLSWRQRHWPVSPWCDALIYVTLAPPLSSGRVATMGWSEQKKTHK